MAGTRRCEIRHLSDVVGVLPTRAAALRLVGTVPAEQNHEWADSERRFISLEVIANTMAAQDSAPTLEVAMIADLGLIRGWPRSSS